MTDAPVVLSLEEVSKVYRAAEAGAEARVLRSVSMELRDGESLGITGPSGSGKSTLLNLIGALDRPTEGRVVLDGQDLASLGDKALARVRARRVGMVFQLHHLLPQCTALENVLVPTLVAEDGSDESPEKRARRLLDRVGLGDRLSHRPGQLSGGECQRVAVVRALINRPALLLADEPTGSLDRAAAENLADLLAELNREEGVALIVATHSARLAGRMSRRIELRDGALHPPGDGP
jgi:predicted ABC-type transport system involved in lysophospholipase L1 biosynthesis ATPase subunit